MAKMCRRKMRREDALQRTIGQRKSEEQARDERRQPPTPVEPDCETQQSKQAQPQRRANAPTPCRADLTEKVGNGENDEERATERG